MAGIDLGLEELLQPGDRVVGRDPAVGVRHGRAVDLGRERPEAGLVRLHLRGHRHRQQRAAVERVVEDDDGRPPRRRAGDLDGVLDRLGARVDEDRLLLLAGARRQLGQAAADLDVGLVDADHEALVEVLVGLRLDRVDDGREAVARVLAADAAGEVDERAAVDVGDAGAVGVGDDELRGRDAGAHVAGALGEDAVVRGGLGGRVSSREYAAVPARFQRLDLALRRRRPICCALRVQTPNRAALRRQRECGCPYCAPPAPSATIAHVAHTVLIVDDHPSFRASARAILEADGFTIVGEAEDGASALALLRRLRPDVVLLDVQLPDMTRLRRLRRVRRPRRDVRRARLEPGCHRLRVADRVERRARASSRRPSSRAPRSPLCFREPPMRALRFGLAGAVALAEAVVAVALVFSSTPRHEPVADRPASRSPPG